MDHRCRRSSRFPVHRPARFAPAVTGLPAAFAAYIPDDPFFLLGNHRLTLFAHASGRLRLISGERGWAALNGRAGQNRASVLLDGTAHPLVGVDAPLAAAATKLFSLGAATYTYALPRGLTVKRSVAVQPSAKTGAGNSAFLLTVLLRNEGRAALRATYEETLTGSYQPLWPPWSRNATRVRHEATAGTVSGLNLAFVRTRAVAVEPLVLPPRPTMSEFDADPPTLFAAVNAPATLHSDGLSVGIRHPFALQPGETLTLRAVFGYSFDPSPEDIRRQADALLQAASPASLDPFAAVWATIVPAFAAEPDPVLRREMRWNAGVLQAMATWREYYDERSYPRAVPTTMSGASSPAPATSPSKPCRSAGWTPRSPAPPSATS